MENRECQNELQLLFTNYNEFPTQEEIKLNILSKYPEQALINDNNIFVLSTEYFDKDFILWLVRQRAKFGVKKILIFVPEFIKFSGVEEDSIYANGGELLEAWKFCDITNVEILRKDFGLQK